MISLRNMVPNGWFWNGYFFAGITSIRSDDLMVDTSDNIQLIGPAAEATMSVWDGKMLP